MKQLTNQEAAAFLFCIYGQADLNEENRLIYNFIAKNYGYHKNLSLCFEPQFDQTTDPNELSVKDVIQYCFDLENNNFKPNSKTADITMMVGDMMDGTGNGEYMQVSVDGIVKTKTDGNNFEIFCEYNKGYYSVFFLDSDANKITMTDMMNLWQKEKAKFTPKPKI